MANKAVGGGCERLCLGLFTPQKRPLNWADLTGSNVAHLIIKITCPNSSGIKLHAFLTYFIFTVNNNS